MRAAVLMLVSCLLLSGCTVARPREAAAEARGYERGYRQAVKEQYWIIQNLQRPPEARANPRTP